jgi:hypothetical protein
MGVFAEKFQPEMLLVGTGVISYDEFSIKHRQIKCYKK